MTKLIFTDPEHAGRVYQLVLEKTTVGRGDQNILIITDSSLSAAHCEILVNGSEVIVRDLGSRNGTYVNGAKLVNQQSQLKAGQIVRFGAVEARLELGTPSTSDTVSEMTAVHAMGRIMRDQRREREQPKPADPSMKLGSSAPGGDADHTVTALAGTTAEQGVAPARPVPAAREPETSSKAKVIVVAVALAAGLIVLLWSWWGGK